MDRRRFLAAVGTGGVVCSAGCLGSSLEGMRTYSAEPGVVAAAVLEETGYEHEETDERVREETVFGRSVELTNYLTRYHRAVDLGGLGEFDAAVFGVLTTPDVTVVGREFNPIADMDHGDLADLVEAEYEEVTVGERLERRAVEAGGDSIDLTTFDGTAAVEGYDEVPVAVDLGRFALGDDHAVVAGIYPTLLGEEADRVTTLVGGVESAEPS